jgi:ABC-type glycerol-3-phosphate transport system permease component
MSGQTLTRPAAAESPTAHPRDDMAVRMAQLERRHRLRTTGIAVAQVLAVLVFLGPIIWMYVSSLRPSLDIQTGSLIPHTLNFDNFVRLFQLDIVPRAFLNSTIVAAVSSVISTVVSTLAAYALDRFRFRGRGFTGALLLAGQLVPGLVILVPLVVALRQLGLGDSLLGLVVANITIGIPIAVLLLRNYIADIPPALEEAAIVDGCTRLGALRRVVLPLLRPAIAAVFAFSFILSWGEYVMALSLITSDQNKTLPLEMQSLFQLFGVDLGLVMAFGVVISLPVAVLFMFIQRSFVSNLSSGGVK